MSPLAVAGLLLVTAWGAVVTFAIVFFGNAIREQRRDRRIESAIYRAKCERAQLEVLFNLPAFDPETRA